jgi:hypothetical protein
MLEDDPIRMESETLLRLRASDDDAWAHLEQLPFFTASYNNRNVPFSRAWADNASLSDIANVTIPMAARRDASQLHVTMTNTIPHSFSDIIVSKKYPGKFDAEPIWDCFKAALAQNCEFRYAIVRTSTTEYAVSLPQAKMSLTVIPVLAGLRRKVRDFRSLHLFPLTKDFILARYAMFDSVPCGAVR